MKTTDLESIYDYDGFERYEIAEFFEYLDDLWSSGITNMFGAAPYLAEDNGLDITAAFKILGLWMKNYSQHIELISRD